MSKRYNKTLYRGAMYSWGFMLILLDTIAKRRQSVHGTRPNSIVNEEIEEETDEVVKLRRLSVPVKQRPKRGHLRPPTLSRLETVVS